MKFKTLALPLSIATALFVGTMASTPSIAAEPKSKTAAKSSGKSVTKTKTAAVAGAAGLVGVTGIAAVAAAVGILDVNYFTKIFKKQLGTTPTQYRREKKAMLGH